MHLLLHCCSLLFVFDLSLATTLQLSSSPNTNGSYCPGKVTLTCVGTDVPIGVGWRINGSIVHTYTFTNQGNEVFPLVYFTSDSFTITIKNVALVPPSTHNITIELNGNVSDLLQSTVLCRTAIQESDSFVIRPNVPPPVNYSVLPDYDPMTRTLTQVTVFWNASSDLCKDYSYLVRLTNGQSTLDSKREMCTNSTGCQVTFIIVSQMSILYYVDIDIVDSRGSVVIESSNSQAIDYNLTLSVEFLPCSVKCYSRIAGTCVIQYIQESTAIKGLVSRQVNSTDIEAPVLQSGRVDLNATFKVGGNTFMIEESVDIQYDSKWTGGILASIIIELIFVIISAVLFILIGVGLFRKWKVFKERSSLKIIFACFMPWSVLFLLISLSCWIAGLVKVTESGNCSNLNEPLHLLIPACVLSGVGIISSFVYIGLSHLVPHHGNEKNSQVKPTDEAKATLDLHGISLDDKKTQQKNKQGLSKAEEYVSGAGHRRYGESMQQGALRVKETIHQAIVQKQNIYDKINREGPDTEEKQNLPTEEYDSLNDGDPSQRQEYDALKHSGTEQQVPPVRAVRRPGADGYDHIALVDKDSKNKENIGGNTIAPIDGGNSVSPPQQGPQDAKQYKRSNGKH